MLFQHFIFIVRGYLGDNTVLQKLLPNHSSNKLFRVSWSDNGSIDLADILDE